MDWLPAPTHFREELRALQSTPSGAARLEKVAELSRYRLTYLETIQLDRAIREIAVDDKTIFQRVRLAILASSTTDHLVPGIRVAALRLRMIIDSHLGAYGQYRQELIDNSSPLYDFKPQVILFSISAREAVASVPIRATKIEADRILTGVIDDLKVLWRLARERLNASVIQQTFLNVAPPVFGNFERLVPGAPARLIDRLNQMLLEAAETEGIALLDIAMAAARDGIDSWFDTSRWLQAKMEISPAAMQRYGEQLARILGAQRGLSKKCLILDLDNTLWGGVIGDDGVDGITLGEGSPSGEAYLAIQRYAKALLQRGIVLAVCSKNDAKIAEEAFTNHPEMILKRPDIACFMANWNPKTENIRLIAEQLNLGLDSMVFVDDNPAERAAIRQELPMVSVPELPSDPAHYVRCISEAGFFEAIAFTADDQQRAEQYSANAIRESTRQSSGNLDDFLAGLQMTAVFGPVQDVDHSRVTQLINKTNQFNTTTRRYSAEEVAAFCNDPACVVLQFRLADRFGDNGLVSVMILRPHEDDASVLNIDTWVMSCRVFGRELEFEAINIAVEAAAARRVRALIADYIPTPKNRVIKNLYSSLGFTALTAPNPAERATRWCLELERYQVRQTHIVRRPQ
jgi:FkbH-like protein